MMLNSFSIRGDDLVGFGVGSTGINYAIHFDIEVWKDEWEKKGITLKDFLNKQAYAETSIRNHFNSKITKFIKRGER